MDDLFKALAVISLIILGLMLAAGGLATAYAVAGMVMDQAPTFTGMSLAVPMSLAAAPAAAGGAAGAKLVDYGTDKDTYSRGDTAKGYIVIRNDGNSVINDVTIDVSVSRSVPIIGSMTVGSSDFKLTDLNIKPGETRRSVYSVAIPSQYKGISTAGDYKVTGKAIVNGKDIGSFSKSIKVV